MEKAESKRKWLADRSYCTITRFGVICGVSASTVRKWLQCDVIPREMWDKLPLSGHIRIKPEAKQAIFK